MADEPIAVDDAEYLEYYESDSAYSSDPFDWQTAETTSVCSSVYQGLMSNGRRYQSLTKREYIVPSDELQFETYEAGHIVDLILNSTKDNPLFQSPIGTTRDASLRILDIGTGKGTWAVDVADLFPNSHVCGVDLYPPPVDWTPPNCIFEVDDVLEEWTWREPFDLIHMGNMIGSFDSTEWDRVYQQCYDKLKPGGWIEQLEVGPFIESDDGTLPQDSALAAWGPLVQGCGRRAGRSCEIISTMSSHIRNTGFVDVHERVYKWPIGPWPKDERIKEAGVINYQHWMSGVEGWCMWLLTNYGSPEPWTKEEVYVYCAKLRNEIKWGRYHCYHRARRIWARKPYPGELGRDPNATRSPSAMSLEFTNLRAHSDHSSPKPKPGDPRWSSKSRSPLVRTSDSMRFESRPPNSSPLGSSPLGSLPENFEHVEIKQEPEVKREPST